jgi:large subunit ribosomal protein L24
MLKGEPENKMFVKKNDQVVVLSGADKNKKGKVLEVSPTAGKVIVEGVRIQAKHVKPKSAQKSGGIQKREGAIEASNVQVICPECSKPTRVGHQDGAEGKKIRVCKKCGKSLDKKEKTTDKKDKKEKKAKEKKED